MADKKFGVKQINLIGASGTPNLTSPNNLNINATTVAISTDVTVGGQLTGNIIGNVKSASLSGLSTFSNLQIGLSTVYSVSDVLGNVAIGTNTTINEYEYGNSVLSIHGRTYPGNPTLAGSGSLQIYSNQTLLGSIYGSDLTGIGYGKNFNIDSSVPMSISCGTTIGLYGTTEIQQLKITGISTFNGAIDANSTSNFQGDVTLQSNLILGDNDEIQLGTSGGDLVITHLSSTNNSLIRNKNASGSFIIDTATGSPIEIRHSSGGEPMGIFTPNGSVDLYYDNSKKLETTNNGVSITGVTSTSTLNVGTGSSIIHTNEYGVGIGTTADVNASFAGGGRDKLLVSGRIRSFGLYDATEGIRNGISVGSDRETIKGLLSYDDGTTPGGAETKGVKITAIDESLRLTANGSSGGTYTTLLINQNGVGIGTTNPTQKLEVSGSVKVGIDTSQGVILTSPNGTKYQLFVENDGTLKTVAV